MFKVQSLKFKATSAFFWLFTFNFLLFFYSCENDLVEVATQTTENKFPSTTYINYDVLYSDSAIVRVRLQGKTMEQYDGDIAHDEFKDGVHLIFFDEHKKVESEMTANHATRLRTTNKMEARGNVVVFNKKGDKLNTEHLVWDANSRKIFTEEHVRITTADKIITGKGLISDETFTNYRVKNITGQIRLR
ncbi:MAG: LPS export ABC transporter periplasmic protein LptC [Flavobacteriales bacterium]